MLPEPPPEPFYRPPTERQWRITDTDVPFLKALRWFFTIGTVHVIVALALAPLVWIAIGVFMNIFVLPSLPKLPKL